MIDTDEPIDHEALNRYVDGELDAETRRKVERHLAENPDDAEAVRAYRAQSAALHRAYAHVLEEPIPDRLLDTVHGDRGEESKRPAWPRPRMSGMLAAVASAVFALALGGFAGWEMRGYIMEQDTQRLAVEMFLNEAISAYSLYAGNDSPWREASLLEDPNKFGQWFKQEGELEISAPELEDAGFTFVGGRALPASQGSAGQMVYRDDDGNMLAVHFHYLDRRGSGNTIQAAATANETAGFFVERDDVSIYHWSAPSDEANFAVVGPLDERGMTSIGEKLLDHFK